MHPFKRYRPMTIEQTPQRSPDGADSPFSDLATSNRRRGVAFIPDAMS